MTVHDDARRASAAPGGGPAESSTSANVEAAVGQLARSPRACAARRSRGSRRATARSVERRGRARRTGRAPSSVGAALRVEIAAPLLRRARRGDDPVDDLRRRTASAGAAGPPRRWSARRAASTRARCRRRRRGARGSRPTRRARRRRTHRRTSVRSLRWVPPANGSLSTSSARAPRWRSPPRPRRASSRGARGCARPGRGARPHAVNSAAEQSARSLMLGLNAARRSTAPISSAIDASRDPRICSSAGFTCAPRSTRPVGRARRASPRGPTPCSRVPRPLRGRHDRRAVDGGEVADGERRGAGDTRARSATTSTGDAGSIEAVAALVLGREVVDVGDGELVALARVPAVEPAGRRRRPGTSAAARAASSCARGVQPVACAGVGPRSHHLALLGRSTARPTAENTPARGGTTTARMPSSSAIAHAWSGPAPPNATSARSRGSTPCSTVTTRTARSIAASTTATTPSAVTPARGQRGARRRRRRAARTPGSSVSAGIRPSTRSASVTVGAVPPRP